MIISNRFADVTGSNNERERQSERDEPHAEAQALVDLDYGGCASQRGREREKEGAVSLSLPPRENHTCTYLSMRESTRICSIIQIPAKCVRINNIKPL